MFHDRVRFRGRQLDVDLIDFGNAVFSGGTVDFRNAVFSDGTLVDFSGVVFSDGTVNFNSVVFSGGIVDFAGASGSAPAGLVSLGTSSTALPNGLLLPSAWRQEGT
ncbi:pentapeptide repeat protein [Streptomyces sp. Ag82_O1-15]|nr:pentapeptide repeat protein [Streptomyces sp. Ag82_O1-15]